MRRLLVLSVMGAAVSAPPFPTPIEAQQAPPSTSTRIHEIVSAVSAERIEHYIERLVGFGTRHTFSDTLSPTRGIGAARRWIFSEFERISAECGGCLEITYMSEMYAPRRGIPDSMNVVDVVAIQRGMTDPNRMVVMSGDIDDIRSGGRGWGESDSVPGANDNASGMAGTIEAALVLTKYHFNGSIVYLGLAGEEQGLLGGRTVARHARENGWNIIGVLNNDMIGNIEGISGATENITARVFSQPTPMSPNLRARVDETLSHIREIASGGIVTRGRDTITLDDALRQMRSLAEAQWQLFRRGGGEVDGPSRQLARYVDRIADDYLPTLDIRMIYRLDRFGRGGHHTPFNNEGFPGVRIMETNENYNRQHQDVRDEGGIHYGDVLEKVDFHYAAKLTALNAATLASLAGAPGLPTRVRAAGANSAAATLLWNPPSDEENVMGYRVYWRSTDSPTWDDSRWVGKPSDWPGRAAMEASERRRAQRFNREPLPLPAYGHRFEGLVIDNFYFGVVAVAADGSESTVVFPMPGN